MFNETTEPLLYCGVKKGLPFREVSTFNSVANPDADLKLRSPGLFYLPCRLSSLLSFLLFILKIGGEGAAPDPSRRSATATGKVNVTYILRVLHLGSNDRKFPNNKSKPNEVFETDAKKLIYLRKVHMYIRRGQTTSIYYTQPVFIYIYICILLHASIS